MSVQKEANEWQRTAQVWERLGQMRSSPEAARRAATTGDWPDCVAASKGQSLSSQRMAKAVAETLQTNDDAPRNFGADEWMVAGRAWQAASTYAQTAAEQPSWEAAKAASLAVAEAAKATAVAAGESGFPEVGQSWASVENAWVVSANSVEEVAKVEQKSIATESDVVDVIPELPEKEVETDDRFTPRPPENVAQAGGPPAFGDKYMIAADGSKVAVRNDLTLDSLEAAAETEVLDKTGYFKLQRVPGGYDYDVKEGAPYLKLRRVPGGYDYDYVKEGAFETLAEPVGHGLQAYPARGRRIYHRVYDGLPRWAPSFLPRQKIPYGFRRPRELFRRDVPYTPSPRTHVLATKSFAAAAVTQGSPELISSMAGMLLGLVAGSVSIFAALAFAPWCRRAARR